MFPSPIVVHTCNWKCVQNRKQANDGRRVLFLSTCAVGTTKLGQDLSNSWQLHLMGEAKALIPSGPRETAGFIKCYCLYSLKIKLRHFLSWPLFNQYTELKGAKLWLAKLCLEAAVLLLTTLISSLLASLSLLM